MAVPYTFGTATAAIPLSQLDSNFATAITIGNTAVQLGNTVTTLNNMTLANVTISSGTITITNVAVTTANVSGTANISTLVVTANASVAGNVAVTGNVVVTGNVTSATHILTGGTANGVVYLDTTKALTTGSALVFDGSNLGVGVTPSAWDSGSYKAIQLGTGIGIGGVIARIDNTNQFNLGLNWKYDGGAARKYIASSFATNYEQASGQHAWYNAPSGTANAAVTFIQAMTLDVSGRLGIGQTSPISFIDVYGNGAYTYARFYRSDEAGYGGRVGNGNTLLGPAGTRSLGLDGFSSINFGIAGSQVAVIDSSGNLLVGTTALSNRLSVVAPSGQYVARFGLNGTGSQSFINFVIGENTTPTGVGSITYNGTTTLYNATSDQRLKENIVDAGTALTTLNQIKIRAFDWIESKTHETHGVVAQELKEVAPQCVTEGIDHEDGSIDRPWQVDTSPLVPMLIKAIQELTARITALEGA